MSVKLTKINSYSLRMSTNKTSFPRYAYSTCVFIQFENITKLVVITNEKVIIGKKHVYQ